MRLALLSIICSLGVLLSGLPHLAGALAAAETISTLPGGEAAYGLVIGPDGLLYVTHTSADRRTGAILVYRRSGELAWSLPITPGPAERVDLRGIAIDRAGSIVVADAGDGGRGQGRIVKIDPRGQQTVLPVRLTAPGALAFDRDGILYVTDGLNGAVIWIGPDGASAPFIEDDRLRADDSDRPGATGLAFAPDFRALYISNLAADRIFKLSINADGSAGRLSLFADADELRQNSRDSGALDGPAGLAVDERGNVLVAASTAREIDILAPTGKLLDRIRLADVDGAGAPVAVAVHGRSVYVASRAADGVGPQLSRFTLDERLGKPLGRRST